LQAEDRKFGRRRIYLMRHGDVSYFDATGRPVPPDQVTLTERGRAQALAAGKVFTGMGFDRVITSGLPRAVETAQLVLSQMEQTASIEEWPELRELQGGRLRDIPTEQLEQEFLACCRNRVPETTSFLRGETIGALFDRVLPALEKLRADVSWDTILLVLHGGVNRAILSYALLGERILLGNIAQSAGCINVLDVKQDDWVVRALNFAPTDPAHVWGRGTAMEELLHHYLAYRSRP
jgi:probable phosphoglycerate mutase